MIRNHAVWIAFAIFAVVIAIGAPYFRNRAVANCNAINQNRIEGKARGLVLREFLLSAAQAREDAAVREEKTNPQQSKADHATAARYLALRARVHLLPIRQCN